MNRLGPDGRLRALPYKGANSGRTASDGLQALLDTFPDASAKLRPVQRLALLEAARALADGQWIWFHNGMRSGRNLIRDFARMYMDAQQAEPVETGPDLVIVDESDLTPAPWAQLLGRTRRRSRINAAVRTNEQEPDLGLDPLAKAPALLLDVGQLGFHRGERGAYILAALEGRPIVVVEPPRLREPPTRRRNQGHHDGAGKAHRKAWPAERRGRGGV